MKFLFLILICAISAFACSNPWKFVFTNGSALAIQQDTLIEMIKRGDKVSSKTLRELKINWWIRRAYRAAPGNLVIRQYCIIDLIEEKPKHERKIKKMINLLSKISDGDKFLTYAEGYSYWKYTLEALSLWEDRFNDKEVSDAIDKINKGFVYTSYKRDDLFYPAPFGDLRDQPLDIESQNVAREIVNFSYNVKNQNVSRIPSGHEIEYHIKAMPVGLNNHCDDEDSYYKVVDGIVEDFKFYQGYDKKYKDEEAEWTDILDIRRILTIPFIW